MRWAWALMGMELEGMAVGRSEEMGARDVVDEAGLGVGVLFREVGRCWKVQLLPKRQFP
jgi:hypothetical protein